VPLIRLVVGLGLISPRSCSSLCETWKYLRLSEDGSRECVRDQGAIFEGPGPYLYSRPVGGKCGARVGCMYWWMRPVAAPKLARVAVTSRIIGRGREWGSGESAVVSVVCSL
jgi:hypothetical protein